MSNSRNWCLYSGIIYSVYLIQILPVTSLMSYHEKCIQLSCFFSLNLKQFLTILCRLWHCGFFLRIQVSYLQNVQLGLSAVFSCSSWSYAFCKKNILDKCCYIFSVSYQVVVHLWNYYVNFDYLVN